MSLKGGAEENAALRKRFILLCLAAVFIFMLLALRLWYLQVISAERYQGLSEKNRIRYMPISAPRGPVYDSAGALLVDNRPSFGVYVLRQDVDDPALLFSRLSGYLGVEESLLAERWKRGSRFPRYRPLSLAEDISRDVLEKIVENSLELPGVFIEARPMRSYPHHETAAHLLGYLGEITEEELRAGKKSGYRTGDLVGKSGLEKKLESYLRGIEGERLVEVDVKGKELRTLKVQEPLPGSKVYLTLRRDVQLAAEEAFGDHAGSAVALDVRTGEVLAMVSRPSFDPSIFARAISGEEWVKLLKNPRHPLQNKAIKGQYPPASTFKIVTALAALKAGVATPSTVVDCEGSLTVGKGEFRCWKKKGHGPTDLKKALRESCDVWFYKVSLDLGIDPIAEMAKDMGLGEPLGFPLEWEKGGLVPTRAWKKRRFGARWYDGETVIASIGQGYVLTTPLQLATMTATFANGGTVYRPKVVKKIEDLEGNVLLEASPEVILSTSFREADLEAVREGLEAVVNEPRGTGRASRLKSVRVAGKTGTAQVVRLKDEEEEDESTIPYRFRDHALFVGYAPAEAPEIAVAVVVEHGSHGGSTAGPIVGAVIKSYFGLDKEKIEQTGVSED